MPHETDSVIGAQMYTLRDHLQTPADIARTCGRVKKMGYEAGQVSAFWPIETDELVRILEGEGLACAATHVSLDLMQDVEACLAYHEALGCKFAALGGVAELSQQPSPAAYTRFAEDFSRIARPLADRGLQVGYHNHSHELARFDGATGLEMLIEKTDPRICFEIDTYWIAHGGGDPAAWIEKVAGRAPCIHVKDMVISPGAGQIMCEVGDGNLNWPRILEACRTAGVRWFLVERDAGDLDPFDSLARSLENMRGMGLR